MRNGAHAVLIGSALIAAVASWPLGGSAQTPSPGCPRSDELARDAADLINDNRPGSAPYVDASHRAPMIAARTEAAAALRDAQACSGRYALTFVADAYELRMVARFYLRDSAWRDDGTQARAAYRRCAATFPKAMGETCRRNAEQLARIMQRFGLLEAHAGASPAPVP